jgi:hypothetical protein
VFVIPLLGAALAAQALASSRYWWGRLTAERPDIVDLIQLAAKFVVPVIEQLRKNGTIPDIETAKKEAMKQAMAWLAAKGFDVYKIEPYLELLDAAIEGEVHKFGESTTTVVVEPQQPYELH